MKTYREMIAWQKSVEMVTNIYTISSKFPKEEIYGLTNQIRRAAVSVPSNIAEGFGRNSKNQFKHFLQISIASLFEMQTQLEIAKNLKLITEEEFENLFNASREIEAMLASFIRKLKTEVSD